MVIISGKAYFGTFYEIVKDETCKTRTSNTRTQSSKKHLMNEVIILQSNFFERKQENAPQPTKKKKIKKIL
jgi:hypothetical protein